MNELNLTIIWDEDKCTKEKLKEVIIKAIKKTDGWIEVWDTAIERKPRGVVLFGRYPQPTKKFLGLK